MTDNKTTVDVPRVRGIDEHGNLVEGFYVRHVKRTPNPIGDTVRPEDVEHLIVSDGFSDWNMPRGTETHIIPDATTVQVIEEVDHGLWKKASESVQEEIAEQIDPDPWRQDEKTYESLHEGASRHVARRRTRAQARGIIDIVMTRLGDGDASREHDSDLQELRDRFSNQDRTRSGAEDEIAEEIGTGTTKGE